MKTTFYFKLHIDQKIINQFNNIKMNKMHPIQWLSFDLLYRVEELSLFTRNRRDELCMRIKFDGR